MTEAYAIAEALRSADIWDADLARALCALAGMTPAWEAADGDSFERVVYQAAEKLGVDIG